METALYLIPTGCIAVMLGALASGSSEQYEEVGGYTVLLGVLTLAYAIYSLSLFFPLNGEVGYFDFKYLKMIAISLFLISLILISMFTGLLLSDQLVKLLNFSQKREDGKTLPTPTKTEEEDKPFYHDYSNNV